MHIYRGYYKYFTQCLIMLFLVGLPGLFLEQSIGQYSRVAINKV